MAIDHLVASVEALVDPVNNKKLDQFDANHVIDAILKSKLNIDDAHHSIQQIGDPQWLFVTHGLSLLTDLKSELTKETSDSLPLLSVRATNKLTKLLNLLSVLGVRPYLLPDLAFLPSDQTKFASILKSTSVKVDVEESYKRLVYVTTTLLDLLNESQVLRTLVLSTLAVDLMTSLVQLGHAPLLAPGKKKGDFVMTQTNFETLSKQQTKFKDILRDLCTQLHQPKVVMTLLTIQGRAKASKKTRKWLTDACNDLLVSRLLDEDEGVLNVIRGVLDHSLASDTAEDNFVDMLARLIATEPQRVEVDHYYSKIQSQLIKLLDMRPANASQQHPDALNYALVASRALFVASDRHFKSASSILMAPLLRDFRLLKDYKKGNKIECDGFGVQEITLSPTLDTLHFVFVSTNATSMEFLSHLRPYLMEFFDVYVFALFTPCLAKTHTEEIILKFVKAHDDEEAVDVLRSLGHGHDIGEKMAKLSLDDNLRVVIDTCQQDDEYRDDDDRATALTSLIEKLNNAKVASNYFSSLLTDLSQHISDEGEDDDEDNSIVYLLKLRQQLFVVRVLGVLAASQSIMDELMKSSEFVTSFITSTIRRGSLMLQSSSSPSSSLLLTQSVNMALTLLTVQLATKASDSIWDKLTLAKADLEHLSAKCRDERVRMLSKKVLALITTRGLIKDVEAMERSDEEGASRSAFNKAMFELTDPLIAVRGHALIELKRLVQQRDKETLDNLQRVIDVFKANLSDDDTYVYQPSIDGLVACCDLRTDEVLDILVDEYTNNSNNSQESNDDDDAMVRVTKAGEALVRVTQQLAELTPKYRERLVNPFLHQLNNKDALIRASALSNLGEVCKHLRFSLGPLVSEIVSHLRSVLEWEEKSEVRSAALLVLRLMLEGLDKDAFIVLRDEMRDIYRCLLRLRDCEWESATRVHLQLVLEQVDELVRSALTTTTSNKELVKKIVVIDP